MAEFWNGTIGIVLQLSAALGVIAAIFGSVYVIVTKTGWLNGVIEKRQIKKRLESCPQKAIIAVNQAKQESKVEQLHAQLLESNKRTLMLQGSHIVLFCISAQDRGYLPRYERNWLQDLFDDYKSAGGNHGVSEIFAETMLLPDCPPRTRRKTDQE